MADNTLVRLIIFLLCFSKLSFAKMDRFHSEVLLGEKRLDSYSERYRPLIFQDPYKGKLSFEDEIFFQNFFDPYLLENQRDLRFFINSELSSAQACPNELFSKHFDEIRYAYRLITLSYLLEGIWHLDHLAEHFNLKKSCNFNLKDWLASCSPASGPMKKLITRLKEFNPKYNESLPSTYRVNDWLKDFSAKNYKFYSHYRLQSNCPDCSVQNLASKLKSSCEEDQKLMTLICSEEDEVYGLSHSRNAYYLLGRSNIINSFNKQGEAMGCLRRFAEVMSAKEVEYSALKMLFPPIQSYLKKNYEERFLQGRIFFFGASKEFEDKGLKDLFVKDQPLEIKPLETDPPDEVVISKAPVKVPEKKVITKKKTVKTKSEKKKEVLEIKVPPKSAFLQAAELRRKEGLSRVEVDMLKLKYDYVFSLNMLNNLSSKLKTFMSRDALIEMMTYDKLGTREGPVPLLFIKYMIDMEEHHGLWNLVSILGDKFFVSNEIDAGFETTPELIQLVNDESTGRQWQINILEP